jgi:drug/metabolite transporter (DMT)-like permease
MMFVSAIFFSIMAVFVTLAGKNIPAIEIIFFRSLISVLILAAIFLTGKAKFKAKAKEKLVFRGIIGGISMMLYFYALTMTNVANAVILSYTYPIFGAIFAVTYNNEKLTKETFAFLVTAFIGVLCIFRFNLEATNLGDILALISGITSGVAIISIRDLHKTDSSFIITFAFVLSGLIFSLPFLPGNMVGPNGYDLFLLIMLGVLGTFGQLLMTYAYKHCTAALGGIISMSAIVMTAIMGIFVFGVPLTWNLFIGGSLIFASASFFIRSEKIEPLK